MSATSKAGSGSDIVFVHLTEVPPPASRSMTPGSAGQTSHHSYSRSHSADSVPPADSDDDEDSITLSRPASPRMGHFHEFRDSEDSVTCQWDGCGQIFTHLPTLIEHIHNVHIGVHKSNYTCEWTTCPRRGLAQTSRFALISHIRSHTGEKPFTCSRPECDKSFTRSDALAKHMRLQHNISPPLAGRGASRKRKRGKEDADKNPNTPPPPPPPGPPAQQNSSFGSFKVDTLAMPAVQVEDPKDAAAPTTSVIDPARDFEDLRQSRRPPMSPISVGLRTPPRTLMDLKEDVEDAPASLETLPMYLRARYNPADGQVGGRSVAKAMYLVVKAKHRFAVQRHNQLLDELRTIRAELKQEKDEKETALDSLLRGYFGPGAEHLIEPVPLPPSLANSDPNNLDLSMSKESSSAPQIANGYYRVRPQQT